MTNRLYYNETYLTEFDAVIEEIRGDCIRLNQSAFYPTSGGQPFDTGTINSCPVTDVFVDKNSDVCTR